MKMLPIIGFIVATILAAHAQDLSREQANKLVAVGQGFAQQATVFEGMLQNKCSELAIELQREGRLENEESAAVAAQTVNAIMTEMGKLYGEFIKAKVQSVLAAKNVLPDEQKVYLLSQLTLSESLAHDEIEFLQPEIFELPLNLSVEQEKKLVVIEADLLIKEVEIERDIELTLLDLQSILLSGVAKPEKVDPLVMNLAELAARSVNNRVAFFLAAKDELNLDQKRLLGHLMGLN